MPPPSSALTQTLARSLAAQPLSQQEGPRAGGSRSQSCHSCRGGKEGPIGGRKGRGRRLTPDHANIVHTGTHTTHTHRHAHTHAHTHAHAQSTYHTCTCSCTRKYPCMHMHSHAQTCACGRTQAHTITHAHAQIPHTHTHARMHTKCAYMHTCTFMSSDTCMHTHTQTRSGHPSPLPEKTKACPGEQLLFTISQTIPLYSCLSPPCLPGSDRASCAFLVK